MSLTYGIIRRNIYPADPSYYTADRTKRLPKSEDLIETVEAFFEILSKSKSHTVAPAHFDVQ
jgi:hypothetical protein